MKTSYDTRAYSFDEKSKRRLVRNYIDIWNTEGTIEVGEFLREHGITSSAIQKWANDFGITLPRKRFSSVLRRH